MHITNPILPGFNPDPSILRVGDDYYIATSTFEWFPGVQIHHSRDLVNWRLLTRPLAQASQLDMRGTPNSGGIWAPCLSHDGNMFHLIYTDVKTLNGGFKDTHNYLVTAPSIAGPWSQRVYLNSSGFDPSMFHDDDGRKWLVSMRWDHHKGHGKFNGILLQEFSPTESRLVGPITKIFGNTPLGATEGPHLYKRDGMYYLMMAEGGTGLNHAVTLARSASLTGPYEVYPQNPVVTAKDRPGLELQKAGHASIVETPDGQWYMVHLVGRPIEVGGERRCILGRETAIQKVVWGSDGWLRLEAGGNEPQVRVPAPGLMPCPWPAGAAHDDFDSPQLNIHFQSLRVPIDESWLSLTDRPGFLRLIGRESIESLHEQSLIARRVQSMDIEAATCVEFEPEDFQQMAGLVAFYDTKKNFYLRISRDEKLGKCLNILIHDDGKYDEALGQDVSIEGWQQVYLKLTMRRELLQFYFSRDGKDYQPIGPVLDASVLSDEYGRGWHFTGAFVGLACNDLTGRRKAADFDFFEYKQM